MPITPMMAARGANLGTPILGQLSSIPVVAYSTRLLSSSYTGKCMNVRRASDNTSMDIGFVDGVLDIATLLSFSGASAKTYVTTWYNQGSLGAAGNAVQSVQADQPFIVSQTLLYEFQSRPAVFFKTGVAYLETSSAIQIVGSNGVCSINEVVSGATSTDAYQYLVGQTVSSGGTGGALLIGAFASGVVPLFNYQNTINSGFTASSKFNNGKNILTGLLGSSAISMFTGGRADTVLSGSGTPLTTSGFLFLGQVPYYGSSEGFTGYMSEIIIFGNQISKKDRQTLEHNQQQFYGLPGQ